MITNFQKLIKREFSDLGWVVLDTMIYLVADEFAHYNSFGWAYLIVYPDDSIRFYPDAENSGKLINKNEIRSCVKKEIKLKGFK